MKKRIRKKIWKRAMKKMVAGVSLTSKESQVFVRETTRVFRIAARRIGRSIMKKSDRER